MLKLVDTKLFVHWQLMFSSILFVAEASGYKSDVHYLDTLAGQFRKCLVRLLET